MGSEVIALGTDVGQTPNTATWSPVLARRLRIGSQLHGYHRNLTWSSEIIVIRQSFATDFAFLGGKELVPLRVFVHDSLDTQFQLPHLP